MRIKKFQDIIDAAKQMPEKTKLAIVMAQDEHTLASAVEAFKEGICSPVLIGDREEISKILTELGENAGDYEIVNGADTAECLKKATDMIKAKKAGAMMKGKLQTGDFMRAIVKDDEMKRRKLLSLLGFYEVPTYHKMFAVSDMGLNTYPDLQGKKNIIENAVDVLHALGIEQPKVACLSSVETVNPKMPDAVDGDALKQMNATGEISGCIVEGPISFDLAMVPEAAQIKGYESPVAGDADLLLVPDIVCGNVLVKCLTELANSPTAGTIVGAVCPLVLTSRSAKTTDKFNSIALAAYAGQNY